MLRILFLLASLWVLSACTSRPAASDAGARPIDSTFYAGLNGVEQYVEIHGADRRNPVLLFIHGGPAWPATPMLRMYNQDSLSQFVTLVIWEQRNCGKSRSDTTGKLSVDQYVADGHALTQFLQQTLGQEKIYLAGHSWGSLLGLKLISQYPEDYAAYLGMGQIVNLRKSEPISRSYLQEQAALRNDTATLRQLGLLGYTEAGGYPAGFMGFAGHRMLLAPYRANDYDTAYQAKALAAYDDYRTMDWMSPAIAALTDFYQEIFDTNFEPQTRYQVPVYFFAGRHDYNTSWPVVEAYYQTIEAPAKQLYFFEQSGHSPQWEEPALFHARVREICR
ncbi:MAG: alpha/beta hydrolase [Bacteroidia bacterium]|nr:alpha/beta hydrolase [Bacteroidia bacterium]